MQDISGELTIIQINGSLQRGGWEARLGALSPREDPDLYPDYFLDEGTRTTDILQRWQRVLIRWRGAFGGPPGVERLAFDGYTMPIRFQFDIAGSRADFIAQTSDGFLRRGWLQGIGFAEVVARTHYHQFCTADPGCAAPEPMASEMNLGKLVTHILGYRDDCHDVDAADAWVAHTNMVYDAVHNPHGWIHLTNVDIVSSATTERYIVRETDNLWSRLREIARNEFYEILFDKTDTLWYQQHPMYLAVLPAPVMTFDEDFCIVPPVVTVRDIDVLRQVRLHAVTDDGDTLHADYPVFPTHTYGNVLDISRIRCNVLASLRLWAERKFKFENREFTVRWTAPGLCGLLFEILDRVQITYTGTDANGVHIDWNEKKFWIHDITVTPEPGFSGRSVFTLEAENV